MAISVSKVIPKTSTIGGYADLEGGGTGMTASAQIITIVGMNNLTLNTKKSLIKIRVPQSEGSWSGAGASDVGDNRVKDLKRVEDTFKLRGWIEDDSTEAAWSKMFKLRAMCASGGALATLVIDNITFSSATVQVYLEEVTAIVNPGPSSAEGNALNVAAADGTARVEIDLTFYMGDPR